jgi:cytochrome c oxidase cbb3-type subunit 2
MPNYAHLFDDGRGDDLVRYLKESGVAATADGMARAAAWKPESDAAHQNGKSLYAAHCMACHGAEGRGDGRLATQFARRPTNLVEGPFVWTGPGNDLELRTARLIKFGIVGTNMAGHEVMTDEQVNALVAEVLRFRAGRFP